MSSPRRTALRKAFARLADDVADILALLDEEEGKAEPPKPTPLDEAAVRRDVREKLARVGGMKR